MAVLGVISQTPCRAEATPSTRQKTMLFAHAHRQAELTKGPASFDGLVAAAVWLRGLVSLILRLPVQIFEWSASAGYDQSWVEVRSVDLPLRTESPCQGLRHLVNPQTGANLLACAQPSRLDRAKSRRTAPRAEASIILASMRGVMFQWLIDPDHVSLSRSARHPDGEHPQTARQPERAVGAQPRILGAHARRHEPALFDGDASAHLWRLERIRRHAGRCVHRARAWPGRRHRRAVLATASNGR